MKYLNLIISGLIAALPTLWIEDYFITNPIWWTVVLAYHFGRYMGEELK